MWGNFLRKQEDLKNVCFPSNLSISPYGLQSPCSKQAEMAEDALKNCCSGHVGAAETRSEPPSHWTKNPLALVNIWLFVFQVNRRSLSHQMTLWYSLVFICSSSDRLGCRQQGERADFRPFSSQMLWRVLKLRAAGFMQQGLLSPDAMWACRELRQQSVNLASSSVPS